MHKTESREGERRCDVRALTRNKTERREEGRGNESVSLKIEKNEGTLCLFVFFSSS
jgi:hypothetical protein